MQRERMECDVLIIGAGPAGLSAAIRLQQLAQAQGREISVCVLEKGAAVGAHILSGAVFEPRALNELFPDWRTRGAPLRTKVTQDAFCLLNPKRAIKLPTPPLMRNEGNYIISLGQLCQWLAAQAEVLGVQIFPGFAAAEPIIENGRMVGVLTNDFGVDASGAPKANFQAGMELRARITLVAEGCRGSVAQRLMQQFDLRKNAQAQTYALGLKEVWEIPAAQHRAGSVAHTIGWPLDEEAYGGSFLYHAENNQLLIGLVVGLDYRNPYLDPYQEFQRFKHHPNIAPLLRGGRRIAYGARALNEGGWQSIPQLTFPGGALIGCSAGFVNVAKIKGSHTAMKSGMLAAESAFAALESGDDGALTAYDQNLRNSWVGQELYQCRNLRPAFAHGLWAGLGYAAIETYLLRGRAPWTFRHQMPDHLATQPAALHKPIDYPAPDGVLSFDRMSSVFLSSTNHAENQPCHLVLKDASVPTRINLPEFAAPEQRYCPAGVYEIVNDATGQAQLQIHAQNCVHCKTCDIKDPTQNILWRTPEGGGGPNYSGM